MASTSIIYVRVLISAPSKLNRIGLPFKDDKAGVVEADWIMVRGPALETGILGRDNRKRECHELCVSGPAHAGFRYGHALKRSSNMIAN